MNRFFFRPRRMGLGIQMAGNGTLNGHTQRPAVANNAPKSKAVRPADGKRYFASMTGSKAIISERLAAAVMSLESAMDMPVMLFVQNSQVGWGQVSPTVWAHLLKSVDHFTPNQPIAILLHSPGGYADVAYRLAQFLRRQCGSYTVVIPAMAKSAATLFSLGAAKIVLGRFGELGPLDAQIDDLDREQRLSALEVVQSLERLNSEAVQAVDAQMVFWGQRSGKKIETLLPIAAKFVAQMMKPLFDKIDTVQYTRMARDLKVAQDYAERLLMGHYSPEDAVSLAGVLTEAYSDHGFVLDAAELRRIGLHVTPTPTKIAGIIDPLAELLMTTEYKNFVGFLREVEDEQPVESAKVADSKVDARVGSVRGRRRGRNRSGEAG